MSDLEDALDKYDKTGSAYGIVGLFVDAARRVANGTPMDWCDAHGAPALNRVICKGWRDHSRDGCEFVDTLLLIDPPEDT